MPTFAEAGVAGRRGRCLVGLFAPAKTPPAVIERLYRAVAAALSKETVRAKHRARQGIPVALKTPAEIAAMLPAKWRNGPR